MSGHNKWSKIKYKKALTDTKKAKVFSKLVKLIQVESKKTNGDTKSAGLRVAIEKAKAENMPMSNIERAIAKGKTGDATEMERVTFEMYGPGGSAIIIEGLTGNNNRTTPEIKHILNKYGLQLVAPGSAMWAFKKIGNEWIAKTQHKISNEDLKKLEELVEELECHDDVLNVYTNV